jgi:hypothetical protein
MFPPLCTHHFPADAAPSDKTDTLVIVSDSGHFVRGPKTGLLYQPRMIDDDECEAVGGMKISRRKSAPVPLFPPQISHDLTWVRTRAAAVRSRQLTAWAMARPTHSAQSCLRVYSFVVGGDLIPLSSRRRSKDTSLAAMSGSSRAFVSVCLSVCRATRCHMPLHRCLSTWL